MGGGRRGSDMTESYRIEAGFWTKDTTRTIVDGDSCDETIVVVVLKNNDVNPFSIVVHELKSISGLPISRPKCSEVACTRTHEGLHAHNKTGTIRQKQDRIDVLGYSDLFTENSIELGLGYSVHSLTNTLQDIVR
jgi:hypothetical protein